MQHLSIELVQVNNGYIIQVPGGQVTVHPTYEEMETELQKLLNKVNGATEEAEDKPAPKKEKKKPAAKKKAAKKEEPEEETEEVDEDDLTLDHVREALRDYAAEHGKPAAKKIMDEVAGVKKMDDIPEDKFADVILACEAEPEAEEELE
jgi:archaellum component FlaD/FlaE